MEFCERIINWYAENRRDLPWRRTTDPYKIWLSEVILQQTRIEQGMPYYLRFIEAYPTVADLAAATEDDVLRLWQGLGYYSRGRNLHAAAKQICADYGGVFPSQYKQIRGLKGVGDYTAAAIASMGFGLPYAVVDGNVYRVLSRAFGISTPIDSTEGKHEFAALAQQLLSVKQPALHNQGMMDLGAMVCTPVNPTCEACPLQSICVASSDDSIQSLPVKQHKVAVRTRYFYYFLISLPGNKCVINRRVAGDIWQGLYDFPLIETAESAEVSDLLAGRAGETLHSKTKRTIAVTSLGATKKHQLTHQTIFAQLIEAKAETYQTDGNEQIINADDLDNFPHSKLIEMLLHNI